MKSAWEAIVASTGGESRGWPASAARLPRDARSHLGGHDLQLLRLIIQEPQVDALTSGPRVAREQLGAALRGADAHRSRPCWTSPAANNAGHSRLQGQGLTVILGARPAE
jgi:hypothetical protein